MTPVPAAELGGKLDWVNAEPQRLSGHRGRVVLLLFWNMSSVYCHNALFEAGRLQRKYPDALSALGIHLPKFSAEQDRRFLSEAVSRLAVQMPVANDVEWTVWQHYAVQSWPTFVLIDPSGHIAGTFAGDDCIDALEDAVTVALTGSISTAKPKSLQAKPVPKVPGALLNPSGLALHGDLLYVADAGHNRIYECTLSGMVKRTFGNGLPLFLDGAADEAAFNRPNGISLDGNYLYVADTGNHAVRRVNLMNGAIDTMLGNGRPGRTLDSVIRDFHDAPLDNPTALHVHRDSLLVADAGNNGLCMLNLSSRAFSRVAGDGSLGFTDGIGMRAKLAHPLALSGDRNHLVVVEGCASALRSVAVPEGRINTLVGQGLYQFGHADGPRQNAMFQHPCAAVVDEERSAVWVADAGNGRIRRFDEMTGQLSTLAIGETLLRPSALALDRESLWIADSALGHLYRYFFASEYLARITLQGG
jgi:sugar lactone lactonase YvrE